MSIRKIAFSLFLPLSVLSIAGPVSAQPLGQQYTSSITWGNHVVLRASSYSRLLSKLRKIPRQTLQRNDVCSLEQAPIILGTVTEIYRFPEPQGFIVRFNPSLAQKYPELAVQLQTEKFVGYVGVEYVDATCQPR